MWRCELHCHSNYSSDCQTSLEELIYLCKAKNIKAIALTDHNEIAGALKLKRIAPEWLKVIIGEEIRTKQGDVIGLFLTKQIAPDQDIEITIKKIRQQGGLVLLPHPFDRLRHEAVGKEVAGRIKDKIDFIEVFNSRCVFSSDNKKAILYAKQQCIKPFVGSDAHTNNEYGNATCLMKPFTDAKTFAESLAWAHFVTKLSAKSVHLVTFFVKRWKAYNQN